MALTLRAGAPEEVGMSPSRIREIAALAQSWTGEGNAQTVAVLVARRGVVILHGAFGRLTPSAEAPPTPLDGIFDLFSITKLLTATAIMILVEEGRVGLNRPVASYVPEFRGPGKEDVLVRHLLTHTSGLEEEQVDAYAQESVGKIPIPPCGPLTHPLLNEYIQLRCGAPLARPPGAEMSYFGFGFELLAEIIRRRTGRALDAFAEERIFKPLGMNDTHYCRIDAAPDRLVRSPRLPVRKLVPFFSAAETDRLSMGALQAVSTVTDIAIFGQCFLNGGAYGGSRILSPATVRAMTRNQIRGIGAREGDEVFPEASWGLGWSIHGSKAGQCGGLYSEESFEHWAGGQSYLWIDPARDLVGVYFSAYPSLPTLDEYAKHRNSDLFSDAVTAAIVDS